MVAEPTAAFARRRYPKTKGGAKPKRQKRIPEYLEADEMNAISRAAPNPKAKLLMLEQWRAGLRVSEAVDLEVRDLSLDTPTPTIRVRSGKGGKSRLVPVHLELQGALSSALAYGNISQGRLVEAHPATFWRWVQAAVKRAEEVGAFVLG
ncbi:MAG: tyrosine-type recombinase/integrase [Chloroflexi bacterium]|nr:tyrosine-type recombinase/integrase [Chloroflexota bacterium]